MVETTCDYDACSEEVFAVNDSDCCNESTGSDDPLYAACEQDSTEYIVRYAECDPNDQGFLNAAMLTDCYNLNCGRDCTVSSDINAAEIADNPWCDCVYHEPQVLLDLYDWNYNGQLDRHEYTMMFNETTGQYNGSWPHSNQKDFNECDLD
jgi:hypothetical protein